MASRIISTRQKWMAPMYNMFQTYKKPFVAARTSMQYIYDQDDKQHLDLLANNLSISVGHCHPRVVDRVQKQAATMGHCSSMYYSEPAAELTEKLLKTMPVRSDGEDWVVQYLVSGGEAVEMAIQMARVTTGSLDLFSLRNSYHGSLGTAMGACGIHHCKHQLPETQHFHHLPAPIYEKKFQADELLSQAQEAVESSTPNRMAGFLFEQVQGYGGIHVLPKDYVQGMAEIVKSYNGVLIADEIQSGLGRMGSYFWSFEMSEVEPDIVVVAKGLSNGHPLSCVIAKKSLFDEYMEHNKWVFFTYGANPVACAAASETLDILPDAQRLSARLGRHLKNRLATIEIDYPGLCLEIRGQGLMWGIELDQAFAADIYETMKDHSILVGLGGQNKNVLRVMPPMCLTENDIDNFIDVLDNTMNEYSD